MVFLCALISPTMAQPLSEWIFCVLVSNFQALKGAEMRIGRIIGAVSVLALTLIPATARAQSTLTGVVKDASGAVIPGVTVEAASPVLIEKTRSVVTDETGGYRIVDLRPGTYNLTFTLEGFSTVTREGLELPSNFTMTVNVE